MSLIFELNNVSKSFKSGPESQTVLYDVSAKFETGKITSIRGKSGSGKSTLLNILAATIYADTGNVLFNGKDLQTASCKYREKYRRDTIGYIPQNLYLLDDRNVFWNIALPLQYLAMSKNNIYSLVMNISKRLEIENLLSKEICTLSGGEKQRVAICRALIKKPKIVLADEPTGSLDLKNESKVIELFQELNRNGTTIVLSTHDESVSSICDYSYTIENGIIY